MVLVVGLWLAVGVDLYRSHRAVPNDPVSCLTEAVYFEARGEPWHGQLAVANVVLNRVADAKFPDSVCAVVRQRGQFSYLWDELPEAVVDAVAWDKAADIARLALAGVRLEDTQAALFYHADYVDPPWARDKIPLARLGHHRFYRD